MLYVCDINDDNISVIDTADSVIEVVTREKLFKLRKRGVLIAGMTDGSIDICNGSWLEDEFFQCCVREVNNHFKRKGFKNDTEIFKYLVHEFNSQYTSVNDLKLTPVISGGIHHFTADCIAELCRLHGLSCVVGNSNGAMSVKVYKDLGIIVYAYKTQGNKKAFRLTYSD